MHKCSTVSLADLRRARLQSFVMSPKPDTGDEDLDLDDHDPSLDDHDPSLDDHDPSLDDHDPSLDDHDPSLDDHDPSLDDHDPSLDDHDPSLDDHDPSLDDHDQSLDDHDPSLDADNTPHYSPDHTSSTQLVSLSPSSQAYIKPIEVDNDERCAATPCEIFRYKGKKVQWVFCERCKSWLHAYCEHVTRQELKYIQKYVCHDCKY